MSATNVKVAKFKTWFYWWKMWKFGIRFLWKHVVNNSCFGIFMYEFKAFMQQQFHVKCEINEPLHLENGNDTFFFKDPKIVLQYFVSSFFSFEKALKLWLLSLFRIWYSMHPKTLWKEFSIPKILFLLQKQYKQTSLIKIQGDNSVWSQACAIREFLFGFR